MEEECSAFSEMGESLIETGNNHSFLLAPTLNQIHGDERQYERIRKQYLWEMQVVI